MSRPQDTPGSEGAPVPTFWSAKPGEEEAHWTWLQCFEAWHPAEVQSACTAKWCSTTKPQTQKTCSKSLPFCVVHEIPLIRYLSRKESQICKWPCFLCNNTDIYAEKKKKYSICIYVTLKMKIVSNASYKAHHLISSILICCLNVFSCSCWEYDMYMSV